MTRYTTIHLWGKGMEEYLGNIMLSYQIKILTEKKLKEIVNSHPAKDRVCYCTFENGEIVNMKRNETAD